MFFGFDIFVVSIVVLVIDAELGLDKQDLTIGDLAKLTGGNATANAPAVPNAVAECPDGKL